MPWFCVPPAGDLALLAPWHGRQSLSESILERLERDSDRPGSAIFRSWSLLEQMITVTSILLFLDLCKFMYIREFCKYGLEMA